MHGIKLTPRLPRGVSRIPHLVHANEYGYTNLHYQQHESVVEEIKSVKTSNRYLTFSRDQATSHIKSLKEELGGQNKQKCEEGKQQLNQASQQQQQHYIEQDQTVDGQNADSADLEQIDHYSISSPVSAPSLRQNYQQPICEAFIMTGQSMLKLSSDESENNHRNNNNQTTLTTNQRQQRHDSKAKSASLNNVHKTNNLYLNSAEEIVAHRKEQVEEEHQEQKNIVNSMTPKPVADRFAAVVLLQNGHKNCRGDELDSDFGDELKQVADISRNDADDKLAGESPTKQLSSPPDSPSSQVQPTNVSPTTSQLIRNDRDSAKRLAKRLYNLSGFKRSDVCHHLSKNNPFSQMVAEEYLSLFDFRSMKLDSALRKFLSKLQLNGETQERERMLSQFSRRYFECNKDKLPNADAVQTLVCALILLNTDLNGGRNKKKRSKLSLGAFIDGLNSSVEAWNPAAGFEAAPSKLELTGSIQPSNPSQLAPGYTFPRHLLVDLYESIKRKPLKWADDKCDMSSLETELDKIYNQQVGSRSNTLPTRRFAPGSNAPSSTLSASSRRHLKQGLSRLNGAQDESEATIEFKSGYLNRKRVFEARGVPTVRGRRAWRRVHTCLQDLRLIMRPGIYDEAKLQQRDKQLTAKQRAKLRAQNLAQDMKNTVKIHHTFAKRSTSYKKREFVFHLRLADQSEFLVQANNEQDMNAWIDTINFASACLSSPALPSAITNTKRNHTRSQRPILPVSYTKLSYWEQLIDHEERLQRLKLELDEHLSEAPNTKKANKRFQTEFIEKIAFLKQDIERYTVYVDLMRKKSNSPEAIILSKHPQIASLTPSEEMVSSLPSFAPLIPTVNSSQETGKTSLQAN